MRIEGITAQFLIPPLNTCWILSKLSSLIRLEDIGIRMLSLSNEQITALNGTPIVIPAATFAGQHKEFVTASLFHLGALRYYLCSAARADKSAP